MLNIAYDLSALLNVNCYDVSRGGQTPQLLVLHNSAGKSDVNDPHMFSNTARSLSDAMARYLVNNTRDVSAHWGIGAEAAGAPLYRLVPEESVAYHAGGDPPQFPSRWVNPDTNTVFTTYSVNVISIGVELYGQVTDVITPDSAQGKVCYALVADLVRRYPVLGKPGHIVTHKSLEGDRTDGVNWLAIAQKAAKDVMSGVATPPAPTPVPTPAPFDPNPQKLAVGDGVLAALTAHNDTAVTNEQFFSPNPGQAPGLGQRSMTWGRRFRYVTFWKPDGSFDSVRVYDEVA